jgi:glutathione reductase (NADPH)
MNPIVSEQVFDLISIGGGSGGLACAQRAAEYGAKAAVIEPQRLGGTCVNVGCVPKKVMWNAASVALSLQDAHDYGFEVKVGESDWAELKAKRDAYVLRLNGIYERNLAAKGVAHVRGAGRFVDAHTVVVNGQRFSARHVVIATGGKAMLPQIPGAQLGISSDGFFDLESRPQRVAVVGSGYIACELAASFLELGSHVEQFVRKERLLTNFDAMLGKSLMREVRAQGMIVQERAIPAALREVSGRKTLVTEDGREFAGFDCVLWAIGRDANLAGLNLEAAGVATDDAGFIITDGFQNTNAAGVYAIGDVTGRAALTPVAIAAGRRLSDRLFGRASEAASGLQLDSDRDLHPSADRHGRSDRIGSPRAVWRCGEGLRGRFHADVSRAHNAKDSHRHEARMRRARATNRRLPHFRAGCRRNAAGIRRGNSHGRHQGRFRRYGGHPSDQRRRIGDDALVRSSPSISLAGSGVLRQGLERRSRVRAYSAPK